MLDQGCCNLRLFELGSMIEIGNHREESEIEAGSVGYDHWKVLHTPILSWLDDMSRSH